MKLQMKYPKQLSGLLITLLVVIGAVFLLLTSPDVPLQETFFVAMPSILALLAASAGFYFSGRSDVQAQADVQRRIGEAERKVEEQPTRARPAWELARNILEGYFNRNLRQTQQIFWVTVGVMLVGFGIIGIGLLRAILNPDQFTPAFLAGVSGVATEFIGVTFLFVYRSVMGQASSYMQILDRINSVGMAVQILDSIPEDASELKNATRADIVHQLLSGHQ